jgi:lipopolysaccharide export system protein LptA
MFFFLFFTLNTVFAERVEITSDSMQAENLQKQIYFKGHVKIEQDKSWLSANQVIVYFDENNQTNKYEATGEVAFEFEEHQSHYKGSAKKVIHYPLKSQYILHGQVCIDDLQNARHIKGETITLDMLSGRADVKSNGKKPVKFIFDMVNEK